MTNRVYGERYNITGNNIMVHLNTTIFILGLYPHISTSICFMPSLMQCSIAVPSAVVQMQ